MIEEGQQVEITGVVLDLPVGKIVVAANLATVCVRRRELTKRLVVVHQRQAKLLHVVLALAASGGFPGLLYGREQQRDEDGDDRNHHQQLDQRKSPLS